MDGVRVIDLGGRQFLAAGDTMVPIDLIKWIGFGARWNDPLDATDDPTPTDGLKAEMEVLICHGEDCIDGFTGASAESFARWAGYVGDDKK
jgi:hypothetical protein